MGEPGTYGSIRAQDRQFLVTNIRAELEANRRYTSQAQATSNPVLARMWRNFARDEARHARMQQAILAGWRAAGAVPWAAAPGPGWMGWPGMYPEMGRAVGPGAAGVDAMVIMDMGENE